MPTSGHGSVTPLSYSNKGMVIALSKVVSEDQPIEFIEANTQLLKALGKFENGIKSSALKHPHTFKGLLVPKLRERPEVFSLMSNTVTLTSGGGSGKNKIADMLDVNDATEVDGGTLVYDAANDEYVLKALPIDGGTF